MTTKLGAALIAFAAAVLTNLGSSYAAEIDTSDIPVGYVLLLDGKDAIYGQFVCKVHVRCQLANNKESGFQLSLTLDSKEFLAGDVNVNCGKQECSFSNWKASTRLEGIRGQKNIREFDLYSGRDSAIEVDLVYRERTKIGRIAILF
ncbi:hypothetical protein [Rhizobium sp. AC27/96]|uniref:hypothetical protein n=1 Tax=Rhizobium sp. AC27/96 TaxID=1841653 RepID=UPI00114706F2|nr:hypothetical protein [Rhizobium sp. AC27/96]